MNDFTRILESATHGDDDSAQALLPLVYDDLRRLAASRMMWESASHTLQPTALVHEAWLRMVDDNSRGWRDRAYFFAAAATAMRRILIDHARKKMQQKRGGNPKRINLDHLELAEPESPEILLLMEDALHELEQLHPSWGKVVVMKYFGGMTNRETAEAMDISEPTVERYWAAAKVWLFRKMSTPN